MTSNWFLNYRQFGIFYVTRKRQFGFENRYVWIVLRWMQVMNVRDQRCHGAASCISCHDTIRLLTTKHLTPRTQCHSGLKKVNSFHRERRTHNQIWPPKQLCICLITSLYVYISTNGFSQTVWASSKSVMLLHIIFLLFWYYYSVGELKARETRVVT